MRTLLRRVRARYGDIEPLWRVGMATAAVDAGSRPTGLALEAFTTLRAAPVGIDAGRGAARPRSRSRSDRARGAGRRGVRRGGLRDRGLGVEGTRRRAARRGGADGSRAAGVAGGRSAGGAGVLRRGGGGRVRAARTDRLLARPEPGRRPGISPPRAPRCCRPSPANPLALRAETLLGCRRIAGRRCRRQPKRRSVACWPSSRSTARRCTSADKMLLQTRRRDAGSQLLQRYLAAHPSGRYAAEVRQLVTG